MPPRLIATNPKAGPVLGGKEKLPLLEYHLLLVKDKDRQVNLMAKVHRMQVSEAHGG